MAGTRAILDWCSELGFALAGVSAVTPSAYAEEFRAWLAAGKHGSMGYLAEHAEARIDPARGVLEGARSAVVVADLYAARGTAGVEAGRAEARAAQTAGAGRIARYARGRDYHAVMKARLHALCDRLTVVYPAERFRACVDTAPVPEREMAQRAGLGWIGKHTLLIHPRAGSYFFLGVVLTTLELDAAAEVVTDHCGTCTRCIEACPTGAITPWSVDARRCISYLTIERRAAISEEFETKLSGWVYGCDVCQEVCPHNSPRPAGGGAEAREESGVEIGWGVGMGAANPSYAGARAGLDLQEVLGWDDERRRAEFAGSAMKRATLAMMKRNAALVAAELIATVRREAGAGTVEDSGGGEADLSRGRRIAQAERLLARLRELAKDEGEDAMVRATCARMVQRLG